MMSDLVTLRIAVAAMVLVFCVAGGATAQSLEEQTRRMPGTNSLHDDSDRLRGNAEPGTDSLDDDSQRLRGRTADQDGTDTLDDGSMDDGASADND